MARGRGAEKKGGWSKNGCLGQHLETAPLLGASPPSWAGLISPSSEERKTRLCTEPPRPWVLIREKLMQSGPGSLLSHLLGLHRSHFKPELGERNCKGSSWLPGLAGDLQYLSWLPIFKNRRH